MEVNPGFQTTSRVMIETYSLFIMKSFGKVFCATALVGFACCSHAAIPSGPLQFEVDDSMNRIWDVSRLLLLQSMQYDLDDGATTVTFGSGFVQTAAGKLTGAGPTTVQVEGPYIDALFQGNYVVAGTITSSRGVARLNYKATARGLALVEGRPTTLTSSFAVKATVDAVNQAVNGVVSMTGSAGGLGSTKNQEELDAEWWLLTGLMGDGGWRLDLQLQNDGVKVITGTATVTLNAPEGATGASYSFQVKGNYKAATDTATLVLAPTLENKGSSLKLTMHGHHVVAIKGKVAGQAISWVD